MLCYFIFIKYLYILSNMVNDKTIRVDSEFYNWLKQLKKSQRKGSFISLSKEIAERDKKYICNIKFKKAEYTIQ